MIRNILSYMIIFSLVYMSGCTDFRTLQKADGPVVPYGLAVGDTVQLETTDDQYLEFEITDITKNSIVGTHTEIPFDKIRSAKKAEINKLKTTGAIAGGTLYAFVLGLMLFAIIAL